MGEIREIIFLDLLSLRLYFHMYVRRTSESLKLPRLLVVLHNYGGRAPYRITEVR